MATVIGINYIGPLCYSSFSPLTLIIRSSRDPNQWWHERRLSCSNSSTMEPAALTRSSPLTKFPYRGNLATLRLARVNSFSIPPPKSLLRRNPLPLRISASLSLPRRSIRLRAVEDHHHGHHHDGDHHHHHHQHGCCSVELKAESKPQKVLFGFAKAIGWVRLANFLREHLHLCCSSAALFLAAAACPYVAPKPYIKSLQNAFMIVGFPLVGVRIL